MRENEAESKAPAAYIPPGDDFFITVRPLKVPGK